MSAVEHGSAGAEAGANPDDVVSLADIAQTVVAFARKHHRLIRLTTLLSLGAAAVYLATATPTYISTVELALDMRTLSFPTQKPIVNDVALDSAFVESQVEIIKSTAVLLPVIKKFRLTENPEFVASTGGPLGDFNQAVGRLLHILGPPSESELTERALHALQNKLSVRREGLSFVIEIQFRSANADLSSDGANAVAEAYIADQLQAKLQVTERATTWLRQSLQGLGEQAVAAESAVVEFKAKNSIVNTGGRLINEQQLAELKTQQVSADAQAAEARAKLDRIETVLASLSAGDATVDAAVADSLKSEIITKLRAQFLELANREADWSTRYGSEHAATIGISAQKREVRASMVDELRRIAETYKSDLEIARQRQESVKQQLASAISSLAVTNRAQITARELESNAQAYRSVYDDFLRRQLEAVQELSSPVTEARVISPAAKPLKVSWPRASIVVAIAGLSGIVLGLFFAMLLDLRIRLALIARPAA
jgi:succinoglycan biosynthesis transport protein ExoP